MNEYRELLMKALDIVKDSDKCKGCVGGCDNCEYSSAFDQIEDAIYDYCELKREYESVKAAEKLCRGGSRDFILTKRILPSL